MRVIIAGSRNFNNYEVLKKVMSELPIKVDTIVSGTARGADRLGERWAVDHHRSVARYPADWDRHGKSAGYRRNAQMAGAADALVLFWDGHSKGSGHMFDLAKRKGLKVSAYTFDGNEIKR